MSEIRYFSAKGVALIACLTALYVAVALVIPGIPVIGATQARISLSATLAPIYGFILGPYLGALVVLFANFMVWIIPPAGLFGMFTIFSPVLSAFVAGALTEKSGGWVLGAVSMVILISAWYCTWVGRAAPCVALLHLAALIVILLLRKRLANWFWNGKEMLCASVPLCSYAGFMADHMFGSLAFIVLAPIIMPEAISALPVIFMGALPVTIAERVFMTIVASLIGSSVIFALRAGGYILRVKG